MNFELNRAQLEELVGPLEQEAEKLETQLRVLDGWNGKEQEIAYLEERADTVDGLLEQFRDAVEKLDGWASDVEAV